MSFIPEKMNSIERALMAAASMAPSDARNVLRLICEGGMTTDSMGKDLAMGRGPSNEPSEGDKHYAKREKFIRRMKSSTDRVCDYARHETLRNIEKHFRDNPQHINAADEEPKPSLAARLTFDRNTFSDELLAALAEDQAAALQTSGQQLFDEIGKDSVWRLPSQDALQFIEDRANLLANVPDEIHQEIMQSIEQGLSQGESRKDLMARISTAFDEIGKGRAETIANTETAAAFNYARDKAMREAGVTHKRWLHSQSPLIKEPRPTHLEADGQIQPIDDPFDVGGVQFMRPSDDSLGAGPEDIINCHCVAIPVEAPIESGEGEGHPFRGNQYTEGLKELGVEEVDLPRNKKLNEMTVDAVRKLKDQGYTVPRRIISKPYGPKTWAYGSHDTIGLTTSRIDPNEFERQVSIGHFSQSNPILHEAGHLEHQKSAGEGFDRLSTWAYADRSVPIAKKVSNYAARNPHEFVAETFAGHVSGKRYPKDVMDHYYEQHGPKLNP